MNPPELLRLDDDEFDGNWVDYERELYRIFETEVKDGNLQYRGLPVKCRRDPETQGKWASFWHLIQRGPVEDDRLPDLRRCERIRWIRWVIENADNHTEIDVWRNKRPHGANMLLWFREEYLVVLGKRKDNWLLRTAYFTEHSGRFKRGVERLRKERDEFLRTGGFGSIKN